MTALAIMGPAAGRRDGRRASILFEGPRPVGARRSRDAGVARRSDRDDLSGADDGAQSARSVGRQIAEPLILHRGLSKRAARERRSSCLRASACRSPSARARLSARTLGGPAPARDDRDGARLRARASSSPTSRRLRSTSPCRRRSSISSMRSASRIGDGVDSGQPRSRGDRAKLRAGAGHVWRHDRWRAAASRRCWRSRAHPYTLALLEARPRPGAPRGERLQAIPGAPPLTEAPRAGCPFAGRCPFTIELCRTRPRPRSPSARTTVALHAATRRGDEPR